ncbi:MAG: bestrophin family protein, partial [Campylobacterales bacterium]
MYIRRDIKLNLLIAGSWKFIIGASLWSAFVVYIHDFIGFGLVSIPIEPLSTIGIAISIYLGFKGKETYDRWWEARKLWGEVIGSSRSFGAEVHSLLHSNNPKDTHSIEDISQKLIYNHLAWVQALKYQLRLNSRFKEKRFGMFNKRVVPQDNTESFLRYIADDERQKISKFSNPAVQILISQSKYIKELAKTGLLDPIRQVHIQSTINNCLHIQGKCERIKKTPFPRPFAYFGEIFTWIFIIALPLGFIDIFEYQGVKYAYNEAPQRLYMFAMVPFTVLISWVFYMMEKISDSIEDPFEGG